MLYGLYQSSVGADTQLRRLEMVANNLANASTTAFKPDVPVFRVLPNEDIQAGTANEMPEELYHHAGAVTIARSATDFSNGSILETGAAFDVALAGPGFFEVSDGENQFLTRRGSFTRSAEDELVMADSGEHILDSTGNPIELPPGATEIQIANDGMISATLPGTSTPVPVAQISIVMPEQMAALQKQGDSHYSYDGEFVDLPSETRLIQGSLEQSAVRPAMEMLTMMESSRAIEMNMNMIQQQEHTLGLLLESLSQ